MRRSKYLRLYEQLDKPEVKLGNIGPQDYLYMQSDKHEIAYWNK